MLLQLQNITFGFSSERQIFKNLSFDLAQGRIYALMGANGSGKTTLFNLITGFQKPHSGDIVFKQQNIAHTVPFKINRMGIGRTFQDLRLISKLTVKENVLLAMLNNPTDPWLNALLPASVFKKDSQQLENKADEILADYFLQDVQDSLAHEISFGQQKLLNLACCVANGAELLLLDEPVAGISPQFREQITLLIQHLKRQGKTIMMIEHNTDFINETGERFLFLDDGILTQFDTFSKLQNSRQAAEGYFL
jgi:ABC-type branched-subunit amino acid transport system ATPase component